MKKMIFHPAFILCVAAFSISSCKKDGSEEPKEPTKTENLTASTWRFDKAEADLDLNGTADLPIPESEIEACDRDNVITFRTNMTGTIDEGVTKCDASDPQSAEFVWAFKENETILSFPTAIVAGIDGDVKLVSLSATAMVLMKEIEVPVFLSPSGKANAILTLKH